MLLVWLTILLSERSQAVAVKSEQAWSRGEGVAGVARSRGEGVAGEARSSSSGSRNKCILTVDIRSAGPCRVQGQVE